MRRHKLALCAEHYLECWRPSPAAKTA
ncbi:MAG: hypothetical protein ACOYZ7_16200 [Chloroflexota bacterium]